MALSHLSDLVGRVLAHRYRIVAPLGTGASGRVYLADDTQLRRRVAIKVLHDAMAEDVAFLKRFRAEAHAAAALNHPNVMHIYDSGADEGLPYLVCEFLGGGSLRAMLDAGERLTPSQALVVGLDTSRGLDYAHRQGLVHRDIKPANLLFGEDGRLRIADFGLARAIAEAAWTEPQGMLLGTARYAAPEQAQGRSVDGRADVYALALVLIEAVTGSVPFTADTTVATLMARCESDLIAPTSMGRLVPVLERAGRLDPAERCDAGELEIALMAAAEDLDRPAPLPLVGAIPAGSLGSDPDFTDGDAVRSRAERDDVTVVLPSVIGVLADADADAADAAADPGAPGSVVDGIDIPLDSDPAPVLSRAAEAVERAADLDPGPTEPRRRRWPKVVGSILVLMLIAGAAVVGWLLLRTPAFDVPELVGEDLSVATSVADENGWELDTDRAREDGTVPDEIIEQEPGAGTSLAEGETLRVKVSLGPPLVALPALPGQPKDAALAAIGTAGLIPGAITEAHDENVPAGSVVAANAPVDAAGQLPRGSTVDLSISLGPQPRTVPAGLVGQPLAAVKQALTGVQLKLTSSEEFSDTVPAGSVIALSQPDGAVVPRDSSVSATVSKGPAPVPVPDVAGRSVTDATSILQGAGFPVAGVEGSPAGKVIATDPPAGEAHQRGTSVRIFTRR